MLLVSSLSMSPQPWSSYPKFLCKSTSINTKYIMLTQVRIVVFYLHCCSVLHIPGVRHLVSPVTNYPSRCCYEVCIHLVPGTIQGFGLTAMVRVYVHRIRVLLLLLQLRCGCFCCCSCCCYFSCCSCQSCGCHFRRRYSRRCCYWCGTPGTTDHRPRILPRIFTWESEESTSHKYVLALLRDTCILPSIRVFRASGLTNYYDKSTVTKCSASSNKHSGQENNPRSVFTSEF